MPTMMLRLGTLAMMAFGAMPLSSAELPALNLISNKSIEDVELKLADTTPPVGSLLIRDAKTYEVLDLLTSPGQAFTIQGQTDVQILFLPTADRISMTLQVTPERGAASHWFSLKHGFLIATSGSAIEKEAPAVPGIRFDRNALDQGRKYQYLYEITDAIATRSRR